MGFLKQPLGLRELGIDIGGGQEAVVTDFGETRRQGVQEESTDELLSGDGNGVVTFGDELDKAFVHGDEPVIGNSHFMGVSAEVIEELLRAAKGFFGVDAPVLFVQGVEKVGGQGWFRTMCSVGGLELSGAVSLFQDSEELTPKKRSHDFSGEEVSRDLCGRP